MGEPPDGGKLTVPTALTPLPPWGDVRRRPIIGSTISLTSIDIPLGADPGSFEKVLDRLEHDADAVGATVTTHKLALIRATARRFAHLDPWPWRARRSTHPQHRRRAAWVGRDPVSVGRVVDRTWPSVALGLVAKTEQPLPC